MSDLDSTVKYQYYVTDGIIAKDITHENGIPVTGAKWFNPCRYSVNGRKPDGNYNYSYLSLQNRNGLILVWEQKSDLPL